MGRVTIDTPSLMYDTQIGLGKVRGYFGVNKFGQNTDIDAAAAEDVWDGGGSWVSPTGSSLIQVFSSSINDSGAGSGAQSITLQGLDSGGNLQEESITTAGAARVPTTNSFSMVHRMFVPTAGSSGTNLGNISALNPTDTSITLAQITAGNAQSLMAIYRIPTAHTGALSQYYGTVSKGGGGATAPNVIFSLWVESSAGGVWQLKHRKGTPDEVTHEFKPTLPVEAGQTVRIEASTDSNDTNVTAGFDMSLVHD